MSVVITLKQGCGRPGYIYMQIFPDLNIQEQDFICGAAAVKGCEQISSVNFTSTDFVVVDFVEFKFCSLVF